MKRSVILLSGGVDSTVLAYHLADMGHQLHCLSFKYGQNHATREVAAAARTAARLHARHTVIPVQGLAGRSSLTGHGEIPDAPTTDVEATQSVVVPGRNLVFLSLAASVAAASDVREIYFAVHQGDAASFPDCRSRFLQTLGAVWSTAELDVCVIAPFIKSEKPGIVRRGEDLGVRWTDTYSCYRGGVQHCGKCGACQGRIAAFQEAGVQDAPGNHKYPALVTLRP